MENPIAIANYFIQKSFDTGVELTPMKLVKLVYIAHGWHLGVADSPLISEPVQAWKYGPVVESVYKEFKNYGDQQITQLGTGHWNGLKIGFPSASNDKQEFLDKVWDVYKDYNGLQLSTLTHQTGTPWHQVWIQQGGQNVRAAIIPNDVIKQHYKNKINGAAPQQPAAAN
jgi:uncharacterized phage-associated protein